MRFSGYMTVSGFRLVVVIIIERDRTRALKMCECVIIIVDDSNNNIAICRTFDARFFITAVIYRVNIKILYYVAPTKRDDNIALQNNTQVRIFYITAHIAHSYIGR